MTDVDAVRSWDQLGIGRVQGRPGSSGGTLDPGRRSLGCQPACCLASWAVTNLAVLVRAVVWSVAESR